MDNELSKIIGQRINTLLLSNNVKQKDLAEYLGVPDNTISYFCNGKRMPNTEQIKKIAEWECFNTSADYLLGLTEVASVDKDIKFICGYTHLNENTIKTLHSWYSSSMVETLNFLNGKSFMDFHDFTHKFVVYKAQYKKLVEYKKQIAGDNKAYSNADEIEKILDEDEQLNDDVLLTEFKIQKITTDLLNSFIEDELQLEKQYSEEYERFKYYLWSEYARLTEVPD